MSKSPIPQELLSLIVDFVGETNHDRSHTFSCLALTNSCLRNLVRGWRAPKVVVCQSLSKRPIHQYLQRLGRIIRFDPSFGACITSLTLVDTASRSLGGNTYGWLMNSEATNELPDVLHSLVSLRSLNLMNSVVDMFIDWRHIDVAVQDALFNLFSSRTLRTLALSSIMNMELTPLIDCANLRELSILSVSLSDSDMEPIEDGVEEDDPGEDAKGLLEYLEVGECGVALGKLVEGFARDDSRLSITTLKKVKIHATLYDDAMESSLRLLLDQSGQSLQELHFRMHLDFNRSKTEQRVLGCLTFHRFPAVRVLDIEVLVNMLHSQPLPQAHIGFILEGVERMSRESLQVLRMNFIVQPLGPYPFLSTDASTLLRSVVDNDLWTRLDSLEEDVVERMTNVEVCIRGEEWMATTKGSELSSMVQRLEDKMSNLEKKGILGVCWTAAG